MGGIKTLMEISISYPQETVQEAQKDKVKWESSNPTCLLPGRHFFTGVTLPVQKHSLEMSRENPSISFRERLNLSKRLLETRSVPISITLAQTQKLVMWVTYLAVNRNDQKDTAWRGGPTQAAKAFCPAMSAISPLTSKRVKRCQGKMEHLSLKKTWSSSSNSKRADTTTRKTPSGLI